MKGETMARRKFRSKKALKAYRVANLAKAREQSIATRRLKKAIRDEQKKLELVPVQEHNSRRARGVLGEGQFWANLMESADSMSFELTEHIVTITRKRT
jgi:hypothetical protein